MKCIFQSWTVKTSLWWTAAAAAIQNTEASYSQSSSLSSYVFLQKFPLEHTFDKLFHTEVLICPEDGFSDQDREYLDEMIDKLQLLQENTNVGFAPVPEDWWTTRKANCREFGYGGATCDTRCCGSPHSEKQSNFPLNDRRAVIGNADVSQKSLYIYGTSGKLSPDDAWNLLCPTPSDATTSCWSNWAGTDYNPLSNNCNTFTSTLLKCVLQLSDAKPDLGVSDLVKVDCDKCPRNAKKNSIDDEWYRQTRVN